MGRGSTGLCFTDNGQPLCAAFDPSWYGDGQPTGTVVVYVAGEGEVS